MRLSRSRLRRGGGWTAAAAVASALTLVAAGQLPAAADAPLGRLTAAVDALTPSGAPSSAPSGALTAARRAPAAGAPVATASTSAGDRLPGALPVASAPASRPERRAGAAPAPAARPTAPRPPAARSVVRTSTPPAAALCAGDGWQERRGRAALAALRGGAARTGFRVDFAAARKGYMGLTHLEERRIEVFVRPCGVQPDALLRHVIAHELGHAYDTTHMTDASRRAWKAARGIPATTDWYGCSGCTDFATPAGDFAEVYAQWARGASTNRSEIGGDVAPARLAQLASQFFGA